jgi:hypothetical protein
MINLISGEELAALLLFEGTTSAFRTFCKNSGIRPVPGRKDCYDPVAVRHKLNRLQGIEITSNDVDHCLIEASRVRRNA